MCARHAILGLTSVLCACGSETPGSARAPSLIAADREGGSSDAGTWKEGSADAGPAADASTSSPAASVGGACTGSADMAVLSEAPVPQLSCEGGACIARNLELGVMSSIDEDGARSCLAKEAPMLKRLSPACRECFLQISLCAPESCVSLLGGASDACLADGLPNTNFASCARPPTSSTECQACQAPCRSAFVRCSGLPEAGPR